MKRALILVACFPFLVCAQDTIITQNGNIIPCKIIVLGPDYVTYSDSSGTFTKNISEVLDKVVHGNPFIITPDMNKGYQHINMAGIELQKGRNTFYGGVFTMIAGAAICVSGIMINKNHPEIDTGEIMTYTGAGLVVVGWFINIASFGNIGKAGKHLEQYKP